MKIRNRIKELRYVRAKDLKPNPKNWRTHPAAQRDALKGILAEVGIAGASLARELDDGSLELIDGHLRAEELPGHKIPVLVLDVTAEEADKLLAAYDPIGAMAGRDDEALGALLDGLRFQSPELQTMLDDLRGQDAAAAASDPPAMDPGADQVPPAYMVLVTCDGEPQQLALLQEFTERGLQCRALMS